MIEALSREELEDRISDLQLRIGATLAPYEVESAVGHWLDTLRGIEELINLPTIDWDDGSFKRELYAFPVLQFSGSLHIPMPWETGS